MGLHIISHFAIRQNISLINAVYICTPKAVAVMRLLSFCFPGYETGVCPVMQAQDFDES